MRTHASYELRSYTSRGLGPRASCRLRWGLVLWPHRPGEWLPAPTFRKRAFTLIEVLVVVAIVGLLVAILLPSLSKAREQARRTACASNQKQILSGIHMYASGHKGWMPHSRLHWNASLTWIVWQRFWEPYGWLHLGLLHGTRQMADPKIFYCPSYNEFPHIYPRGWNEFSAANGGEVKATGYMYTVNGQVDRYPPAVRPNLRIDQLKTHEAVIAGMFVGKVDKHQLSRVWPHQGGVNSGHADGSVQLINVRPAVSRVAAELFQRNSIGEMDYFSYCFFQMLSGNKEPMNAFAQMIGGR